MGTVLPLTVRISREAHWLEIEHVNAMVAALIMTPLALTCVWFVDPNTELDFEIYPRDASLLGGMSFLALCLQTRGFQLVEASVASMMWYVQVPSSYALQWLVFHETPSWISVLGASCVL